MTWGDLAARARGLATHVAGEAELDAIDRAADRTALAAALVRAGITPAPLADPAPLPIERAAQDRAAADLAVLARWVADRDDALAPITDDLDRESLRVLVRGLVAGVTAAERLLGTVPTSGLPLPVLRDLAAQVTGPAFAERLAHHHHPAAAALAGLLAASPIDLLAVELALARWFAARARAAAGADHALGVHVAQVIDVANASAAMLLAARGGTLDRAAGFVDGGAALSRAGFVAAAAAPAATCAVLLARAFAGTPLADAFAATTPGAIEQAALAWHLATQRGLRRQDPLGLAAVVWLVLIRRAEQRRLRRAAWRLALGGAS